MPASNFEVRPDQLRRACDPTTLGYETTAELPQRQVIVGQDRAMAAIAFGLEMEGQGYNIFAAGPSGTGRSHAVLSSAAQAAAKRPASADWCYVYNFSEPRQPRGLRLAPGQAPAFANDVEDLVRTCLTEIPRAFETEAYEERKEQATGEEQTQRSKLLEELERQARAEGFMIQPTPMGLVTVPLLEGKPLSREQFEELPEDQRKAVDKQMEVLRERIQDTLSQVRQLERKARQIIEQLDREVAMAAVGDRFSEVRAKYQAQQALVDHLEAVMQDLVDHQAEIRGVEGPERSSDEVPTRYRVNVLVTNEPANGAPIVQEHSPTYYNLVGRLEYRPVAAGAITDHMLIKPGAIHRANGGYLILQALDMLTAPFAWEALRRTLRSQEITIENIGEQWTPIPAATLRPDPIPLDLKVILIGSPLLYFLLYHYDEEFGKLFKVKADFDSEMSISGDGCREYGAFIGSYCIRHGLRHLTREAVARLMDYGRWLVEDQEKLTTQFSRIAGLLEEANYWAGKTGADHITAGSIETALEQREYRVARVEARLQEYVQRGDLAIAVEGAKVGQINGLAVLDVGDHVFGRPSRISARTAPGRAGIIDIEREARLSGQIHQKAVMILSGYLHGTYGGEAPLSLSATIAFEQSYGPVEGDSASCAELYAILSSLSDAPIKQGIAVTGSVDQYGTIQVIGGVNYKIEGFYETCNLKGLTGEQGVLIPANNVKNLMLKPEVVQAVREGKFHLWAVSHVDEGIEVLTGLPAGSLDDPESIHGRVQARLKRFSEALQGGKEERMSTIIEVPPTTSGPRPPEPPEPPRQPPGPPPPIIPPG